MPSSSRVMPSKKYAYEHFRLIPEARQVRFEGLFGVYYDESLKEVPKRNKNIEATIGKFQSLI